MPSNKGHWPGPPRPTPRQEDTRPRPALRIHRLTMAGAGLPRSGGGGGEGAQRRERRAPGGDLVQQRVEVRGVAVARLEDGVVLEIGRQRQRDLLAHIGYLQFPTDLPQVLGCPGTDRKSVV